MKQKRKKLVATWQFHKKMAMRQTHTRYYSAQFRDSKDYVFREKEKARLRTPKWEVVTDLIEKYKKKTQTEQSKTGRTLLSIYKRNCKMAKGEIQPKKNSNLLQIVARTETLMLAYK